MTVTHKINIDLTRAGIIPGIKATQGDANTRQLEITLKTDSAEWAVPEGTSISVAFRSLRDGHKGWYDQLPDGTPACSFNGNVVTAILAPAVLSSAGDVKVAVVLQDASLNQLATFGVTVTVEPNPAAGTSISNDYYRYTSMEAIDEAVDTWLTETEAEKNNFLAKAEDALTTIREAVTTGENAPAIISDVTGESIAVSDASDRLLHGLVLYGKTTQNGTPSPEAPVEMVSVGSGGTIAALVARKNIVSFDNVEGFNATRYAKSTVDGQSVITVDVDTCQIAWASVGPSRYIKAGGVYTFSAYIYAPATTKVRLTIFDSSYNAVAVNTPQQVSSGWHWLAVSTRLTSGALYRFCVSTSVAENVDISFNRCMVEFGSTATDYEEYDVQSMSVSTPNGLPGIPVPSGGNYTDASGQQWIADEIDLARGMYVQRVHLQRVNAVDSKSAQEGYNRYFLKISALPLSKDSSKTVGNMCSHFRESKYVDTAGNTFNIYQYNGQPFMDVNLPLNSEIQTEDAMAAYLARNEVWVAYTMAAPIESPLSADEIAAFAAIHSNYPNTTVYNDAGAGMKVSYVADTKRYIDNKFAALSAAIVNNA